MKQSIFILFIISILFSFCACSNTNNISDQTTQSTAQEQESITIGTNRKERVDNMITVKIGDKSFSAQLYDNETAKAFADMLPLTLNMQELHGNEKYYYLDNSLPTDSMNIGKINCGDIMLYGSNCIVLFYDSLSTEYSYTKIGHIENTQNLANAAGSSDVTIIFEK